MLINNRNFLATKKQKKKIKEEEEAKNSTNKMLKEFLNQTTCVATP